MRILFLLSLPILAIRATSRTHETANDNLHGGPYALFMPRDSSHAFGMRST